MEQIIQETGEARESFTMLSMFGDYLKPLEAMFPTQTEKIEAVFASQEGPQDKAGLRVVMFLMLHVCIYCKVNKYDVDMKMLWDVYRGQMKGNKGLLRPTDKYHILFHNIINLTMGFIGAPVRNDRWVAYIMDAIASILTNIHIICLHMKYRHLEDGRKW